MVQKSADTVITKIVLIRALFFITILVIGFVTADPFYIFLTDDLGYKEICSGPFCLDGFATGIGALTFSYLFWIGVVFGALGKRYDYITIGVFSALALIFFYGLPSQVYLGLFEVILFGNLIGLALKFLRQKLLAK